MTHSEGLIVLATVLTYAKQQSEASATGMLMFRRWRDLAARKRQSAGKQTLMISFFFLKYCTVNTCILFSHVH